MFRSSLPGSGIPGVAAALSALVLAACLPQPPGGAGMNKSMAPPAEPSMMDFSSSAGESTIGAVPRMWSKEYGLAGKCEGDIKAPATDLAKELESSDSLGTMAVGEPGKGKLCRAKVFEAIKPIKVYRVWSSDKRMPELGTWWTLEMPMGSKDMYMQQYGKCASWGKYDQLTECTMRPGVQFAIGPTQSRTCGDKTMRATSANQLYIPVGGPNPWSIWFTDCKSVATMPLTN
jgi:hypothetical protein